MDLNLSVFCEVFLKLKQFCMVTSARKQFCLADPIIFGRERGNLGSQWSI